MKAKYLRIHNIGLIKETDIPIHEPLILFFGGIRMGKTTILNAVRWVFGGSYPEDIITHGRKEAYIELELDNGSVRREFYIGKDGKVKDRAIMFVRDGKPVKKPVDELRKLLNPYLLDQDYLRKMTELERKQYFTELFAVDTSEIDFNITANETMARDLRNKIKGYGDIDLTEYQPISVGALQSDLAGIKAQYKREVESVETENKAINKRNLTYQSTNADRNKIEKDIFNLRQKLADMEKQATELGEWLKNNPIEQELPLPIPPDTSELESQILNASATNVKAEQYQKNLARANEKKDEEKKLHAFETTIRELRQSKIKKLAEVNEKIPVKDMAFDEHGNFIYQGTSAGMLSTSQLINLSTALSGLYPEELGIQLLDRAESLGDSVFEYVQIAIQRNTSILATIVGEKPAKVPDKVGVWVVEDGIVKKEEKGDEK